MRPLLLFVVTEDRYFLSHRLPMARAAQAAGFDVAVVTRVTTHTPAIEAAGIRVVPFSFARGSLNPFAALASIIRLYGVYQRENPYAIHHIAMQPILYGALAAWLARVRNVINAFAGLGYVFTAEEVRAKILRAGLLAAFRALLKRQGSLLLLQNEDDHALLAAARAAPEGRTIVIPGSGVDLETFRFAPLPEVSPHFIVVFSGRMIDIKGLPTLQEAFARIESVAPQVRLWLCGTPDLANPGSWTDEKLRIWAATVPNVVYKGECRMADIWPQAHCAVQPSWGGEGVPKALLEAAACGRPLVATNVAGCRDVVEDVVNGYLVPPHDAAALADAIIRLAGEGTRCRDFGQASRERIVAGGFSSAAIERASETLYRRLLPRPSGDRDR